MSYPLKIILTVALVFGCCFVCPVTAEVTVSPLSYTLTQDDDPEPLVISNQGEDDVRFSISLVSRRWEQEEGGDRLGPRRDERGGPDDMTYEWRDDQEDDGPEFDWIDILEMEDVVEIENMPDDTLRGPFELGFDFEYYGEVYDRLYVSANGFITFLPAPNIVYFWPQWEPLPNANFNPSPPPTMMAVNYQDLNPIWHGQVFFWTNERDLAVVTWSEVAHYVDQNAEGDLWTFQLILHGNGLIKYQYAEIGEYDNQNIMIGLQNEDRDLGFTVIYNDFDYLEPERTIAFGPEGAWINWLACDPQEGEIAGGEEQEVDLELNLEDLEDDVYYAAMFVNVQGEEFEQRIEVPWLLSINSPVGDIEGTITNAADREPIEGALVRLEPSGIIRYSDVEGEFSIPNLPVGTYTLTCSYGEFFDFTLEDLAVEEGETADGSMALLHAEFALDHDEVIAELPPDDRTSVDVTASNRGNAAVTYTSEFRLLGEANAEPWEWREDDGFDAGGPAEDNRIVAVAFVDGLFYVAGGAGGNPNLNRIYVFNPDGELQREFDQFMESRYGMRDLAYDGRWLWGCDGDQVFGFTTDGDLEVQFDGPLNPTRNIAYDTDEDLIWVSSVGTDLVALDREGNEVRRFDRPEGLRMIGLAYWPNDPDGCCLYIYGQLEREEGYIFKMNTENGASELVTRMDVGDERFGGVEITNQMDIYSWVIVAALQNSDRVAVVQLQARKEWVQLDPTEGSIEAGQEQDFEITLDSHGFPEVQLEGEIVFRHDGFGREARLPVTLSVRLGRVHTRRTLQLEFGWNMVSVNLQPDDEDVRVITRELVDRDLLILMKDGAGHFYRPDFDFNNIPGWFVEQGYLMKVDDDCELTLEGVSVLAEDPIDLVRGWQIVSYYPRVPVDARVALSRVEDHLEIAKDGEGNFYIPAWDFCNMDDMREGRGYQLKMDADVELVYSLGERAASTTERAMRPVHFGAAPHTGVNMSLLAIADETFAGCELAAFDMDGVMVGSGVFDSRGRCGIAVWGDDASTAAKDGLREGEPFSLRAWDVRCGVEVGVSVEDVLQGGGTVYRSDGLTVLKIAADTPPPGEFSLSPVYPNPFNEQTRIAFALPVKADVKLSVFDISGRVVETIVHRAMRAGRHHLIWRGSGVSAGIYLLKMEANGVTRTRKMVLVK